MNSIKGGLISLFGVSLQQIISLGGIFYLARILTPSDFGIYAICFAIFLFFQSFLDFGLTPIYLKYPVVNKEINSSFLSINLFFGGFVALALLCIAPFMVMIYGIDVLFKLFIIQAGVALTLSLSNQPFSQLIRNQKFYHTEIITVSSNIAALIVAIILAFKGFGPIALAAKHLTYGLVRLLSSLALSKAKYQFVNLSKILEIKSYIIQAYNLTMSRLITGISGNIEKLMVAKIFGEYAIGQYERALFVVEKPNTFRNALTTPAMSYIAKMDKEKLTEAYSLLSQIIFLVIGIPCLFFHFYGQELTLLILGDQWVDAGEYVTFLAFLGFALLLKGVVNIMHINELKTKELIKLYWLNIIVVYPPIIYILFISPGGMVQFTIIYSFLSFFFWLSAWVYTIRLFSTDQKQSFKSILYVVSLLIVYLLLGHIMCGLLSNWSMNIYVEMIMVLFSSVLCTLFLIYLLFPIQIKNQYNFIMSRIGYSS